MRLAIHNDDDGLTLEVDADGISYLIEGLQQLTGLEPGDRLACPAFMTDDADQPAAVGEFMLKRAPDSPEQET